MLLHKDSSIQLYGMHAWACLLPWDPMAIDCPERVTPLLEEGFMWQWADQEGIDPLSRDGAAPTASIVVIPEASPDGNDPMVDGDGAARASRSKGKVGSVPSKRRVANAKARAEAAQQAMQAAEGELQSADQRRHGFETWAALVEERLGLAQIRLDGAAALARAAEGVESEIRQRVTEMRETVELAGTEAVAARRRLQAAGRSVRAARSVRRLRRAEDEFRSAVDTVEAARQRERMAAEELASEKATLDRALVKTAEATKAEASLQRKVTTARRNAAKASLAYADLLAQLQDAGKGDETPPAEPPRITDAAEAETEAREAKAELLAAAAEVRSVADMVAASTSRAQDAQAALVEAHREMRRADAEVRELEAAVAEAEQRVAESQPPLAEAQADAHASSDRVVAMGRSMKVGRHVWRLSRAHRRVRKGTALLALARREAEEARARLEQVEAEVEDAKNQVKQGRGVEADARRGFGEAHRRLGSAVATLSRLRWVAGQDVVGDADSFQYLVIAREREVLGNLSLDQWAHRATGHWVIPRFILEKDDEALWLYRGEWVIADPSLTLDDLAVLRDAALEIEDAAVEMVGAGAHVLDLEAVQFTWERDGGRCTKCGSIANLVIDHIIPFYLGGGDTASNLQLLCRNCSREKSHRL